MVVTSLSRSCWQNFESADIVECVFGLVRMKAEQGNFSRRWLSLAGLLGRSVLVDDVLMLDVLERGCVLGGGRIVCFGRLGVHGRMHYGRVVNDVSNNFICCLLRHR
jgi:hypothetical protein